MGKINEWLTEMKGSSGGVAALKSLQGESRDRPTLAKRRKDGPPRVMLTARNSKGAPPASEGEVPGREM
jgi:hypothetical protein